VPPTPSSRAAFALAFGAGGFFLVYFGQIVLGVTQPEIQVDLELDHDEAGWVVNAFMLGLAALVPLGGRLADVLGARRTVLVGLGAMALGAAGAALSGGFGMLVASLAVQGAGAGVGIAATLPIVTAAYPPEQRGHAIGRYVGLGVLALPLAPLAAGTLVDAGDWRLTFWLSLAITLAILATGLFALPREPRQRDQRVDLPGAATAIAGVGLVLGGAVQAAVWGWTAPATLVVMATGVASIGLFMVRQLRAAQPLVDLALLRDRVMGGAAVSLFLTQVGTNGFAIYMPIYLLTLVGLDPLITGVALLVAMVFPPALSPIAGGLADRIGTRALAVVGGVLAAAGCTWLAVFVPDEEYWILVPGIVLFGVGIPIAFAALLTAGAGAAPPHERGAAAGVLNSARWIGATAGTVAFGAVLAAVRESRLDESFASHRVGEGQSSQVDHMVLDDEEALGTGGHDIAADVIDVVGDAFAAGYAAGFWLCAGAFLAAAAVAALALRPRRG
jgi:EmrB/QacA subfamily drug resistance transporter